MIARFPKQEIIHADQLSKNISHPTTLDTIHIRHINSVARQGVLKAGVDYTARRS